MRRALDPDRVHDTDDLIASDRRSVWLRLDRVDVDVEMFLTASNEALAAHSNGRPEALQLLTEAVDAHRGPALPDEPYAEWASALQSEVAFTYLRLLEAVADQATTRGDHLTAANAFRRLVEEHPLDTGAHRGLVDALEHMGAVGLAEAERRRYERALGSD